MLNEKIYKVRLVSIDPENHYLDSIQIMEFIPSVADILWVPSECFDKLAKRSRYEPFARTEVISRETHVGLTEPITLKLKLHRAWIPNKVIKAGESV